MTKQVSYMIGALLALTILSVTILVGLGRDVDQLLGYLTSALIPAIAAIWAGGQAQKAVNNTNGRMRELVQTIQVLGGTHLLDRQKYGDLIDESPSTPKEDEQ